MIYILDGKIRPEHKQSIAWKDNNKYFDAILFKRANIEHMMCEYFDDEYFSAGQIIYNKNADTDVYELREPFGKVDIESDDYEMLHKEFISIFDLAHIWSAAIDNLYYSSHPNECAKYILLGAEGKWVSVDTRLYQDDTLPLPFLVDRHNKFFE